MEGLNLFLLQVTDELRTTEAEVVALEAEYVRVSEARKAAIGRRNQLYSLAQTLRDLESGNTLPEAPL